MENVIKVAWAFDPYSDIDTTWKLSLQAVENFKPGYEVQLNPIYVVGAHQLDWIEHLEDKQLDHLVPMIEKAITSKLNHLGAKTQEPIVVKNSVHSRRDDVELFLNACDQIKADLILVNTHGRSGLKRLFLGSFAETVSLKSQKPVLFVSPHQTRVKKFDRVVYPSNFSKASKSTFEKFLASFANGFNEITIYSKVFKPIHGFVDSGMIVSKEGWLSPDEYFDKEQARRQKAYEEFSQIASAYNIKTQLLIDNELGDVAESLEQLAKDDKVDLVVMGSYSSAAEAFFIGSISRSVIRSVEVPVMVYHA